jgi:competence protein ComEC
VLDTDSAVYLGKPGWIAPSYWASMLRESMDQVISKTLPTESAAILESMVFGLQGSEVSRDLEEDFRHSGTVHLLVVSGSQVMMLVVTLLWLCRRLLIPRKPTALIIFLMVVFYTLMTGGGSPVIRAAVAGSLAVWGMGLSRETDRWTLLAAAALFLLLLNPLEIHNSSFQLSFAAVIGLLAFTTPIYNLIFPPAVKKSVSRSFVSKGLHRIALLISISIAAQLTTAPLIAYYFQELTPVGVIANLAAVPLAGLLLPLGFLTAGFGSIWLPLGKLLGWADLVIIKLLVGWVQILAHLPSAYLDLPPVSVWILICWYGILFLVICRPGWISGERLAVVGATCFLLFLIIWGFNLRIQQPLRGYFLSVGKGRSTLILTPSGKSILIDGGGPCFGSSSSKDYGQRVILPALKSLGIRKLDLMIACDGDLIHTAGLVSVAKQIPVRLALLSPSLK